MKIKKLIFVLTLFFNQFNFCAETSKVIIDLYTEKGNPFIGEGHSVRCYHIEENNFKREHFFDTSLLMTKEKFNRKWLSPGDIVLDYYKLGESFNKIGDLYIEFISRPRSPRFIEPLEKKLTPPVEKKASSDDSHCD